MKQLKLWCIAGIIFVLTTGTAAHFLYGWTNGNFFIGLFTPVNESVWEHMKLLFFPMLLFSSVMAAQLKGAYPCIASSLCFGILAGTLVIPAFFYGYTFLLGRDVFVLDLLTFFFSVLTAFFSAYKLTLSCQLKACRLLSFCLVWAFFLCFMLFTYQPPKLGLFSENGL